MPPAKKTTSDVSDIVTRHDERIATIISSLENHTEKNESIDKDILDLKNEIKDIKHSLDVMQKKLEAVDGIWGRIFDSLWKIALMIIGGAILYFLNLQSPPID
jgi:hypothetical protein